MTFATQHVRSTPSAPSTPSNRAASSARSLSGFLLRLAREHPDRTALTDGDRTLDYRTLDAAAAGSRPGWPRPAPARATGSPCSGPGTPACWCCCTACCARARRR